MAALDEVRKDIWHDAYSEYKQVKKDNPRGKGRPKKDDPEFAIVKAAKAKADEIKGSAYALGTAPVITKAYKRRWSWGWTPAKAHVSPQAPAYVPYVVAEI